MEGKKHNEGQYPPSSTPGSSGLKENMDFQQQCKEAYVDYFERFMANMKKLKTPIFKKGVVGELNIIQMPEKYNFKILDDDESYSHFESDCKPVIWHNSVRWEYGVYEIVPRSPQRLVKISNTKESFIKKRKENMDFQQQCKEAYVDYFERFMANMKKLKTPIFKERYNFKILDDDDEMKRHWNKPQLKKCFVEEYDSEPSLSSIVEAVLREEKGERPSKIKLVVDEYESEPSLSSIVEVVEEYDSEPSLCRRIEALLREVKGERHSQIELELVHDFGLDLESQIKVSCEYKAHESVLQSLQRSVTISKTKESFIKKRKERWRKPREENIKSRNVLEGWRKPGQENIYSRIVLGRRTKPRRKVTHSRKLFEGWRKPGQKNIYSRNVLARGVKSRRKITHSRKLLNIARKVLTIKDLRKENTRLKMQEAGIDKSTKRLVKEYQERKDMIRCLFRLATSRHKE